MHDDASTDHAQPSSGGWQPVQWRVGAPRQPAPGEPCNGCGLCCLAEPCPAGMIVSRKRRGPCAVLRWDEEAQRYWCGLLSDPARGTGLRRPWALRWLKALARRWIAAGTGCDAQPLQMDTLESSEAPRGP